MATIPIDLTGSPIAEETSQRINFTVVDENGDGIPVGSLTTLTVTLFNVADSAIINSRDGTDIKNANGGELDIGGVDGVGAWTMDPDDNEIIGTSKAVEYHTALFEWTWATTKEGRQPVSLLVVNLKHVP